MGESITGNGTNNFVSTGTGSGICFQAVNANDAAQDRPITSPVVYSLHWTINDCANGL